VLDCGILDGAGNGLPSKHQGKKKTDGFFQKDEGSSYSKNKTASGGRRAARNQGVRSEGGTGQGRGQKGEKEGEGSSKILE